ncbi:clostripain-related cysteine peptidase [Nocardioides sp. SR21]|uniref:clostripain-related cysteine peptidase n=1 Tax=Nocardioides sp. SR21 TaxID=2919501 RepID=UPI001FAA427D|nr:clostripain-related cysteine peptidase [Nocardioides sp. SR21]
MSPLPTRITSLVAATSVLLLLAACSGGGSDDDKSDSSSNPGHTGREGDGWTVLHYSMGDTNLEPFMVTDVNELGEIGSNENLHIREFMDRSAEYGEDPLLDQGDWVGGRILDLGEPGTSEVVEDMGDVDSADPAVLAQFIADGIEANRAGHYALIISDHGASWPGIGPDEGTAPEYNVLDLNEIVDAVSTGLEEAGVDQLDLLGFDACLMANYEVASAVAPLADRLVASQELEPGHGWDYRSLQVLAEDPDATADELGEALIDGFEGQAVESGTQDTITLSMVDLTKMGALDDAMSEFADTMTSESAEVAAAVGQSEATTLGFGKNPDETQDKHLRDLGLFAAAIGENAPEVADLSDAVVSALDDAVLDSVDGTATAGATGLTIYIPPVAELSDAAYLDVSSTEDWGDFLAAYYGAGEAIPADEQAQFTDVSDGPDVAFDADGVTLTGVFDPAGLDNITEATISYAFVNDDGSITYFGEEIADFEVADDGTPTAYGTYDLTAMEITDGEDSATAYVTLDLSDDLETAFFDVPLTYYASTDPETPQDALLSLVLNIEAGEFESETIYIYDEESGGYGELAPDPEGIIVPDVLTITADGEQVWEPTTDVGLYADIPSLNYDFVPLDSGTPLQVDLSIYDFGGNLSTVSSYVEVP